jgi:hypothetical protein
MFKFISSFFQYNYDSNNNQQNDIKISNFESSTKIMKKYNCTFCFESFHTLNEQKTHILICKQIPKPINNIKCNRCGRYNHLENNCFEIKHIYGYYLRKNNI